MTRIFGWEALCKLLLYIVTPSCAIYLYYLLCLVINYKSNWVNSSRTRKTVQPKRNDCFSEKDTVSWDPKKMKWAKASIKPNYESTKITVQLAQRWPKHSEAVQPNNHKNSSSRGWSLAGVQLGFHQSESEHVGCQPLKQSGWTSRCAGLMMCEALEPNPYRARVRPAPS